MICTLCSNPSTQAIEGRALCDACATQVEAYQTRLEQRLARLQAAADKAQQAYQDTHQRAHDMAAALPFGQPILVGHHSEGRDRRYRERIHKTFAKAFDHYKQAKTLEGRAAASANHAAIASDDPLAITKLTEKITAAKDRQQVMKEVNAILRAAKTPPEQIAALVKGGFGEGQAVLFQQMGRYAPFELANNNANIKRMEARLKELQAKKAQATAPDFVGEERHGDVRLIRDAADNRLRLVFPGKPDAATIKLLKTCGFIWSSKNGAWQRQLNNAAEYAAERVLQAVTR